MVLRYLDSKEKGRGIAHCESTTKKEGSLQE